jgi:hypothetical protein
MSSKIAVAKEALKESLIGHEDSVGLSAHTKARFLTHAVADAESGELYLGPEEFLKAVVPKDEDFVSQHNLPGGERGNEKKKHRRLVMISFLP